MSTLKNKVIFTASLLVPTPVLAHNVKTSGNVAATFHIEPNHNPKAGEASTAWFALTKQGGELISLDQCNCQVKVIQGKDTIAQPTLKAIKAEQYQGIPGAEITFPKAGIYTLEISGKPKTGDEFNEFKLAYEVTVQAGQTTTATSSAPVAQAPSSNQNWTIPAVALGVILLAGIGWIAKRTFKK